jgi:hypothetical protein
VVAILPRKDRPAHVLYIPVYVSQGVGGTLQVNPNGALVVFSNTPHAAQDFTSLGGVSFAIGA